VWSSAIEALGSRLAPMSRTRFRLTPLACVACCVLALEPSQEHESAFGAARPRINAISREVGSSNGGTALIISGSRFELGATVAFGGRLAAVTMNNATQIGVVTPSHASGVVDVVVTNPGSGSFALKRAFDYEPGPTIIYFSENFEEGSTGRLFADHADGCLIPFTTDESAAKGTRAVKTGGHCYLSRLEYRFCAQAKASNNFDYGSAEQPCNPAASDANGLYHRFFFMMPQSTIDAVTKAGTQMKLHLARGCIDLQCKGYAWDQTGFGLDFQSSPANQLRTFSDSGVEGNPVPKVDFLLKGGVWYEVQFHYKRDVATHNGRFRMWVNGVLLQDVIGPHNGSDGLNDQQSLWIGQVTSRVPPPFSTVVYVDDVAAANGWIER
jgi:hypothetical protein